MTKDNHEVNDKTVHLPVENQNGGIVSEAINQVKEYASNVSRLPEQNNKIGENSTWWGPAPGTGPGELFKGPRSGGAGPVPDVANHANLIPHLEIGHFGHN